MFMRRPFFFGRILGLFLLLGGLFLGFAAAYRAGQANGYRMGAMTTYQQTTPRSESASPESQLPFYGRERGWGGYGMWGVRPHFGFGFFPLLCCLVPLGLLVLGGLFSRRHWHHGKHGPMGGPWGHHPGKANFWGHHPWSHEGPIDPDEPIQKA